MDQAANLDLNPKPQRETLKIPAVQLDLLAKELREMERTMSGEKRRFSLRRLFGLDKLQNR